MNDNEFWLDWCKIAGVVFIILCILFFSSCQYTKYTVNNMIQAGANPIEAACALKGDGHPSIAECIINQYERGNKHE